MDTLLLWDEVGRVVRIVALYERVVVGLGRALSRCGHRHWKSSEGRGGWGVRQSPSPCPARAVEGREGGR